MTSPSTAAVPTVKPDEQLKTVLPGPPVAIRSFPQNEEVAIFAEVYDTPSTTPHKVDITTTVATDEGKVMFKTDEARDSSNLAGKSGGYGFLTNPLKDLAPGNYVLTVSAKSRVASAQPAERQVRLIVAPPLVPTRGH